MVPVDSANIYSLRDYLLDNAVEKAGTDPYKISFLVSLDVLPATSFTFKGSSTSLYQKCAISGLGIEGVNATTDEFTRLLGQASTIDGTPRPWVADVWGVLGIKYAVDALDDDDTTRNFSNWIAGFLPERIKSGRLDSFELDVARYINGDENPAFTLPCVALYLHYKNLVPISTHEIKQKYIGQFFNDFKSLYESDLSSLELALYVYVFDKINMEASLVPPNSWGLSDILSFLENIPAGLKRWTWEEKGRTKGATPRNWHIDNEYHVQNFLYVLLAPMFEGISDEENLESVGQKNPRVDLYLPSAHEVDPEF